MERISIFQKRFSDEIQLPTRARKLWLARQIPPSKNLPNLVKPMKTSLFLSHFSSRVNLEAMPEKELLVLHTSLPLKGTKRESPVARDPVTRNILAF